MQNKIVIEDKPKVESKRKKIAKTILLIAVAILFLVTSISSLFSASRISSQYLMTYVFRIEQCEYREIEPKPEVNETPNLQKECKIDYNRTKEVLSESISLLILALPISCLSYRKLSKLYKEEER